LTLANGACGILSIVQTGMGLAVQEAGDLQGAKHFHIAAWLILIGMVFDALDGLVARVVGRRSASGVLLDCMSDLLTVGAAPSFLVFGVAWRPEFLATDWHERLLLTTAVTYALAALLRLARFPANPRALEGSPRRFRGLPSPAAAGVVVGAVLVSRFLPSAEVSPPHGGFRSVLLAATLAASLLMVSRVPYPPFVSRVVEGMSPFLIVVTGLAAVVMLAAFGGVAIGVGFWAYAVLGLAFGIGHLLHAGKRHSRHA
jgi:CDP-diacylglycerol--serine O-phosphatidyltransferase